MLNKKGNPLKKLNEFIKEIGRNPDEWSDNKKSQKDIAAFPEELPYRAIKLFSYKGETVLDPFLRKKI